MTGTSTAFLVCSSSSRYRSAALVKLGGGGEVVERLGEMLAAGFEGERQPDLLGDDLLLEQRRQHDGAHAGVGQSLGPVDVAGERAGRGHDRRRQRRAPDRSSSGLLRPVQSSLDLLVVAVPGVGTDLGLDVGARPQGRCAAWRPAVRSSAIARSRPPGPVPPGGPPACGWVRAKVA